MRQLLLICVLLLVATPYLNAQTTSTTSSATTLADNEPSVNAAGAAVRSRAPGTLVTAALARHTALRDARLEAQRSGDNSNLLPEESTSSSSSSSTSGLLSDLLNSVLGGSTTTSTSTGTSTNNFSNLPDEVIQMLSSFGISLSDLQNAKQTNTTGDSTTKTSDSSQTTTATTETTPFRTRWANAMLSTLFSSLSVAVQSSSFITLLEDAFRPLFGLDTTSTTSKQLNSSVR